MTDEQREIMERARKLVASRGKVLHSTNGSFSTYRDKALGIARRVEKDADEDSLVIKVGQEVVGEFYHARDKSRNWIHHVNYGVAPGFERIVLNMLRSRMILDDIASV